MPKHASMGPIWLFSTVTPHVPVMSNESTWTPFNVTGPVEGTLLVSPHVLLAG